MKQINYGRIEVEYLLDQGHTNQNISKTLGIKIEMVNDIAATLRSDNYGQIVEDTEYFDMMNGF